MVTVTDGSQLVDNTETNLFNQTTPLQHYFTYISTDPMISTDVFVIRGYVQDKASAGTERKFLEETLSGVQDPPMFFIPYIPADKYRISMQRTSATNRTFLWRRIELP